MKTLHNVFVDAKPLAALFPGEVGRLGEKASWSQSLEVLYTPDKSDPAWDGIPAGANGVLLQATERAVTRHLYAAVAVDVGQRAKPQVSLTAGQAPESKPPDAAHLRFDLFQTLLHEYVHALQFWRRGASLHPWQLRYDTPAFGAYADLRTGLEDAFRRHGRRSPKEAAYLAHPWEQQAEELGMRAASRERGRVYAGAWDYLLPVGLITRAAAPAPKAGAWQPPPLRD